MLYTSLSREGLLDAVPKGGVACEIGVHRGDFSAHILAASGPKRLHLVDPWAYDASDPQEKYLRPGDGDETLERIRLRFATEIMDGRIRLHRETSQGAAKRFSKGYFDWIYIDGDHRYEAVLADLRTYAPLIKPGGLILGDDYTEPTFLEAKEMDFGVVQAVKQFLSETGYSLVALTDGVWANYAITDLPNGEICERFLSIVEALSDEVTIMPDPLSVSIQFREHTAPSGKMRLVRYVCPVKR